MRSHGIEIAVVMQKCVTFANAVGAYQKINSLSNSNAPSPQNAIVFGRLQRDFGTNHRYDIESQKYIVGDRCVFFVSKSLHDLAKYQVADQYLFLSQESAKAINRP